MELLTIVGTDETEELFLEIPESIILQLGWDEGTEIDWKIEEDSIILTKVKDTISIKKEYSVTQYKEWIIKDYLKNIQNEG